MRKININITKAQIERFTITLNDERPEVNATISLTTEGGQKIAEYSISTNAWQDENKFELPPEMIFPIRGMMDELERVVIAHCNEKQLRLMGGEPQ